MIVMNEKRKKKNVGKLPLFDFDIPVRADMEMDSFGRFELRIPGIVKNIHELNGFERDFMLKCLVVSLTVSLCLDEKLCDITMNYMDEKLKEGGKNGFFG